MQETLHFLLDHPRRCYTLLFPPHQTWFLLTIVLALTYVQIYLSNHAAYANEFSITDWIFFLALNLGIPSFSQLSVGVRVINGLLQAATIRSAGFTVVPTASLAPAVKLVSSRPSTD